MISFAPLRGTQPGTQPSTHYLEMKNPPLHTIEVGQFS
jgi:hypothetical protein